jgi:hypothetical protein
MDVDIVALSSAAEFWENAGYLATSIVVLGVVGEAVADLTTWIRGERRRKLTEKLSVLLLIAGLAAEILAQVQSNNKNSLIIGALNKEASEAQLQLQQMRFPRRLDSDKFKAGIEGVSPQFFEVLYDQSAADGSSLADQIFVGLRIAGWKTDQKLPVPLTPQLGPPDLQDVYQLLPLTEQSGGSAWGVSVVTKGPISEDPKAPEQILCLTLLASVASPVKTVGCGKEETMPTGKIRIIVGPKLP